MRICVDYRALNKATVKNKYLVPLVQDLMGMLSKTCWFTKVDLGAGYWKVRIAEGDEPKTTCTVAGVPAEYDFMLEHKPRKHNQEAPVKAISVTLTRVLACLRFGVIRKL
uniref:Reverse transcriptase domain-containing protein n=1 Tax=Solanum lycopersicum TaxID=4081 RepID=A0A3Q7EXC7_SOLLC